MTRESLSPSPLAIAFEQLRSLDASWCVELGKPSSPGWITGTDLRDASHGPFNELLERIGQRAQTNDKRTIAASFALRFGWTSAMGIAPFLLFSCVPDLSLENISLKFRESTFLERTAIHEARGVMLGTAAARDDGMAVVDDRQRLLQVLRAALIDQATPVVEALYRWSGFSRRGTWGQLTSSWASHFTGLFEGDDQRHVWPDLMSLFAGDDVIAAMQPRLHTVTMRGVTHLYQRRASCCRWYLLPQGELCTSCPLVSDEDRLARNRAWMATQLERSGARRMHT